LLGLAYIPRGLPMRKIAWRWLMRSVAVIGSKWTIILAGMVLLLGGGCAWLARDSILAWYYVHGLSGASDEDRGIWVERVARLDSGAVERLIDCLARQDPQACSNVQTALAYFASQWGSDNPRLASLAQRMTDRFPRLSRAGQCCVLELFVDWLKSERTPSAEVMQCVVHLLTVAGRSPDTNVRVLSLSLADATAGHETWPEAIAICRELIRKSFQDVEPDNRARAAALASRPDMNLLPQVVPLLDDPAARVRQAAMLALASSPETVLSTDDLLRSLHDPDEEVRKLCEATLKEQRRLRNEDVALARLLTDAQPGMRLQVIENLRKATNLEHGVWLRRLSHDTAPAVRAAAIRAAGEQIHIDLSDRLSQMAQNDPSPTIRQLASYYLAQQKQAQLTPR
jgi:HEAT repeat protein